MRNLDILAAESGEHVRVLLCREEQSYVVSCQHFRMPYPVASDLLAELQPVPAETYSVFVLDEDITNRQREGRNRKHCWRMPVSMINPIATRLSARLLPSMALPAARYSNTFGAIGYTKVKMHFYPQSVPRQNNMSLLPMKRPSAGH